MKKKDRRLTEKLKTEIQEPLLELQQNYVIKYKTMQLKPKPVTLHLLL